MEEEIKDGPVGYSCPSGMYCGNDIKGYKMPDKHYIKTSQPTEMGTDGPVMFYGVDNGVKEEKIPKKCFAKAIKSFMESVNPIDKDDFTEEYYVKNNKTEGLSYGIKFGKHDAELIDPKKDFYIDPITGIKHYKQTAKEVTQSEAANRVIKQKLWSVCYKTTTEGCIGFSINVAAPNVNLVCYICEKHGILESQIISINYVGEVLSDSFISSVAR